MSKINKRKVFVAMSGGVDSSVAAAILKERGFDVTGVFIKVWSPEWLSCDWQSERRDAMRVAARLKIPFLTFDFEKEYKESVVDYMIDEYRRGRVPNPDVMCNRAIKFGVFIKKAVEMGADFVATGHYVRSSEVSGEYFLSAGVDSKKDQSYFLWTLNQKDLSRVIFPVGEFDKAEVRQMAEKFNLHNAAKKDSQGVCFLGKIDLRDFLKKFIEEKRGDVMDVNGRVIGSHDGAFFYTIGQRHGFLAGGEEGDNRPYYVVSKDMAANIVVVSHDQIPPEISVESVEIKNVNWVSGDLPDSASSLSCRLRYRQALLGCKVLRRGERVIVAFTDSKVLPVAGQSLVVYNGDVCLGGGVVDGAAVI